MKLVALKPSALALLSAGVASLCCLLPLAVVILGLGSGAFMAVTMRYASLFIPLGILGTGAGYYLYFRERRRCDRLGCPMVGRRVNLALLVASTVVLVAAVTLTAMPDYTARLIASWGGAVPMADGMSGAAPGGAAPGGRGPASSSGPVAMATAATATLEVDGMT
ncbi:MAG: hypothetical protein HYV62_03460 [Candidatus Rokubacteria bacterium]|nr:hypothetical protein [Candidatus Rokubacteria bacterium]